LCVICSLLLNRVQKYGTTGSEMGCNLSVLKPIYGCRIIWAVGSRAIFLRVDLNYSDDQRQRELSAGSILFPPYLAPPAVGGTTAPQIHDRRRAKAALQTLPPGRCGPNEPTCGGIGATSRNRGADMGYQTRPTAWPTRRSDAGAARGIQLGTRLCAKSKASWDMLGVLCYMCIGKGMNDAIG